MNNKEAREFSKEDVRFIIVNWEKMSNKEIAETLRRPQGSISYIAARIRQSGYNLPKRSKSAITTLRIKEVLKELKLN